MEVIQLARGADAGEARVRFAGTDRVFAGHFPHFPVLPGVVLIDAAVALVARLINQPLRLESLASVKFCSAVFPDEEIGFTFKVVPAAGDPGRFKVSGRWVRDAEKLSEMVFTAAPAKTEEDRS